MDTEKIIHDRRVFWFIVGITTFGLGYIAAITYIPIPKENIRFADTCLGFLLGTALTAGISYLLVGTPDRKKDPSSPPLVVDPDKKDDV